MTFVACFLTSFLCRVTPIFGPFLQNVDKSCVSCVMFLILNVLQIFFIQLRQYLKSLSSSKVSPLLVGCHHNVDSRPKCCKTSKMTLCCHFFTSESCVRGLSWSENINEKTIHTQKYLLPILSELSTNQN